jgi:hypothetical protein
MMMLTIGVISVGSYQLFSYSVVQLFSWPMAYVNEGKISFFSGMIDPIEAFCIFVSPKQKGENTSIL